MSKMQRRHLQPFQRDRTCEWIKSRSSKPTWAAVVTFILKEFNIDRKENTVCRDPHLIAAMKARAKVPPPFPDFGKPTAKKLQALIAENDKLKVRVVELEAQVEAYLEERITMINFASAHQFTEADIKRGLFAVDRNHTSVNE